jgi:uncharacterized membrane protein
VSVLKVMTSTNFDIKSEIKSWLKAALKKESLTDIVVNEVEKDYGYMGDIVFASVSGKTEDQSTKDYEKMYKWFEFIRMKCLCTITYFLIFSNFKKKKGSRTLLTVCPNATELSREKT